MMIPIDAKQKVAQHFQTAMIELYLNTKDIFNFRPDDIAVAEAPAMPKASLSPQ